MANGKRWIPSRQAPNLGDKNEEITWETNE